MWSEPWNGEGGTSGSSVLLGSVEWTANAPARTYITIHRCRVTRAGDGPRPDLAAADPRQPVADPR